MSVLLSYKYVDRNRALSEVTLGGKGYLHETVKSQDYDLKSGTGSSQYIVYFQLKGRYTMVLNYTTDTY